MRRHPSALLGATLGLLIAPLPAAAEQAAITAAPPRAAPRAPAPPKEKLPVSVEVRATSPDPPWILRIQNHGERPVRVPADARLLDFSLKKAGAKAFQAALKCKAPAGLAPASFPKSRELYLAPGEVYEEAFDPRLFCFGGTTDQLREGAELTPRFGFSAQGKHGPFAAQAIDRPASLAPLSRIDGSAFALPAASATKAEAGALGKPRMARLEREGSPSGPPGTAVVGSFVDRNEALLDLFVDRFEDASEARHVTLHIRAVNEGQRTLATLLRGRMLTFTVEELGPDNTPRNRVECASQHAPHAAPRDLVIDLRPGGKVVLPILLDEVCPRGSTFQRPGLYRVTASIDTSVGGEALEASPLVARTLARQPALIRLARGPLPYHLEAPEKAGPPPGSPAPQQADATEPARPRLRGGGS